MHIKQVCVCVCVCVCVFEGKERELGVMSALDENLDFIHEENL